MPFLVPSLPAPPEPTAPVLALVDTLRLAVLAEQRAHCASSTFDRLLASLTANHYPTDVTTLKES